LLAFFKSTFSIISSSASRSLIARDISASKKLAFCEKILLFESRDDSRSIHVRKTIFLSIVNEMMFSPQAFIEAAQ
jgi:hypothetical protein